MKRLLKLLFLKIPVALILFSLLQVTFTKWVPVAATPLMLKRAMSGDGGMRPIRHRWVSYENISASMKQAVIASEDSKFTDHNGFALEEIEKMWDAHLSRGSKVRGCSTISQQTAKNCFTLCSHTWLRKGVEAYYTVLIELIWGKKRILEVYLNVAETGKGLFGVEAAAQEYYGKHASELTIGEAADIACCLPNPLKRTPSWAHSHSTKKRNRIINESRYVTVP